MKKKFIAIVIAFLSLASFAGWQMNAQIAMKHEQAKLKTEQEQLKKDAQFLIDFASEYGKQVKYEGYQNVPDARIVYRTVENVTSASLYVNGMFVDLGQVRGN